MGSVAHYPGSSDSIWAIWRSSFVERRADSDRVMYVPSCRHSSRSLLVWSAILGVIIASPFLGLWLAGKGPAWLLLTVPLFVGASMGIGLRIRRGISNDHGQGPLAIVHTSNRRVELPRRAMSIDRGNIRSICAIRGWIKSGTHDGTGLWQVAQVQLVLANGQRVVACTGRGDLKQSSGLAQHLGNDLGVPVETEDLQLPWKLDFGDAAPDPDVPLRPKGAEDSRNAAPPADN